MEQEWDLSDICSKALVQLKNSSNFPVDKGILKERTIGHLHSKTIYVVSFDTPYAKWLEEGTRPHDIPHAFGYGSIFKERNNPYTGHPPFGVGGKFDGKFHPGSTKRKGFIENRLLPELAFYIADLLGGTMEIA